MTVYTGVGIGLGVAVGPVARLGDALPAPENIPSPLGAEAERARFSSAAEAVARELNERGAAAGGTAQDVLEAQAMMVEDPTLADEVSSRLEAGASAEWAAVDAFGAFRDMLVAAGGYLGERAADLDDVAQRVLANLRGVPAPGLPDPGHPYVLVAHDLAPADTALLDLTQVLAVVTADGGPTSHTAILAREKGITAVVGVTGAADLRDGTVVVVDAEAGEITADPSADLVSDTRARVAARAATADAPAQPGALADGTPVQLLANLGSADAAADAAAKGAEGVGLFRTEFLFLSATQAPSVADQQAAYVALLQAFPGKKVIVRVLDAGADKPLAFLNDSHEENPALGVRGIRALRANEQILRDQLTALAAADALTDADLRVMAPMVSTVDEAQYFSDIAHEHGLDIAGVMVETPASALIADRILAHSAFASIGTNDLTQYTMAADRLLGAVAVLQSPWHPAVLTLVKSVGAAGAAAGKPVGICGEAAADPLLAVVLVGLGATSLSMAPSALADVRASLTRYTLEDARRIAQAALAADDATTARSAARSAAENKENE